MKNAHRVAAFQKMVLPPLLRFFDGPQRGGVLSHFHLQQFHRALFVGVLAALVLHPYAQTAGGVHRLYGGIGGVDVLASGA